MERGLFCSLYTDGGSHYFHTPEAGGKVEKDNPALRQLGHIPAYSPETRGRSERMFGTLQKRLSQELRLASDPASGIVVLKEGAIARRFPRRRRPSGFGRGIPNAS